MVTLLSNLIINFFLSKYIVNHVGVDAYGYIQLAINMISFFTVVTIALNSMAARFVSVSYFQTNHSEALRYYSSVFFSNIIIVLLLTPFVVYGIIFLDLFIKIESEFLISVQILFLLFFISFVINLFSVNANIAFYIRNKLDIQSIINMFKFLIYGTCLFLFFRFFTTDIIYVGIAFLISIVLTQAFTWLTSSL